MPSYKVYSILHHIDEQPTYWTMVESDPTERTSEGFQPAGPIVGTGLSKEEALADFKSRTLLSSDSVEIIIVGIDNTNCDVEEMLENSPPWTSE